MLFAIKIEMKHKQDESQYLERKPISNETSFFLDLL